MFRTGAILLAVTLFIAAAPMPSTTNNTDLIYRPVKPPQTTQTQQSARPDDRGTASNPLIVETYPRRDRTSAAAKAQEKRTEERDNWIVFWTGASAIGTSLLFLGTLGQIALFVWQLKLIRESLDDAKEAADAAKVAADASKDQAETLKDTLTLSKEVTQRELRAYVDVDEVKFDDSEVIGGDVINGRKLQVKIIVKNFGKTPAKELTSWSKREFVHGDLGPPNIVLPEQIAAPRSVAPGGGYA